MLLSGQPELIEHLDEPKRTGGSWFARQMHQCSRTGFDARDLVEGLARPHSPQHENFPEGHAEVVERLATHPPHIAGEELGEAECGSHLRRCTAAHRPRRAEEEPPVPAAGNLQNNGCRSINIHSLIFLS